MVSILLFQQMLPQKWLYYFIVGVYTDLHPILLSVSLINPSNVIFHKVKSSLDKDHMNHMMPVLLLRWAMFNCS